MLFNDGQRIGDVGQDELKKKLSEITQGIEEGKRKKLMGRIKNERKTDA